MKNAIIMAGGKGTRMKSEQPKVLHEILGESMLGWVIHSLKDAGVDRIVSVVGYNHEEVEAALAGKCVFALQEPQLGTGHAVMQAKQLENETGVTIVASGDGPSISAETYAMMYDAVGDADMALLYAIPQESREYGRIIRKADGTVEKIVEYKDASDEERAVKELNVGVYAFKNESLFAGLKLIKNNNAQHEYYLTDLVEILLGMGKKVIAVECKDWKEGESVNDNVQLAQASAYLQERINTHWMKEGVTIVDPRSTYIGPHVKIGHDVVIYPNVHLYGNTVIEDYVTLYPGVFLENETVVSGTKKK